MSTLHKIAMRDIRGKNSTKGQPLTTRTKKTQFQSESLSCICAISSRVTQPTLGPESSRSIYNRHTEVAKRANTNFENWTAQWSVFEHEPIAGNVGEVQGIVRVHNVFDAIGALVGPVWATLTIRERAPKDRYKPTDDLIHWLSFLSRYSGPNIGRVWRELFAQNT
ncbi:hypothetical protein E4U31_007877 [Claviceps sp. LM219 group G6]|nr:hypothetical protein E4U31_007877 [Claviceps sp. LM219 group G6]